MTWNASANLELNTHSEDIRVTGLTCPSSSDSCLDLDMESCGFVLMRTCQQREKEMDSLNIKTPEVYGNK